MKKSLIIFLTCGLMFCGCRGGSAVTSENHTSVMRHIGICQSEVNPYKDLITEGFSDALSAELSEDSITYTKEYITDDMDGYSIINDFVKEGDDLILTTGEPALSAAGLATEDIPIITTDVINIPSAIDIDALTLDMFTRRNVTGINGMPDIADQLSLILEVTPDIQKLAIMYSIDDTYVNTQIRQMKTYLDEAGIASDIFQYGKVKNKQIAKVCKEYDAIFIPSGSRLYSESKKISKIAIQKGVPTIGGDTRIGQNTLVCLCPNYYRIGYSAGLMAAGILEDGKNPALTPIEENESENIKLYNGDLAKEMGITFPKSFHLYDPEDLSIFYSGQ